MIFVYQFYCWTIIFTSNEYLVNSTINCFAFLVVWSKGDVDLILNGEINPFSVPSSILVSLVYSGNPREVVCTPEITGKIVAIPTLTESQVIDTSFSLMQ